MKKPTTTDIQLADPSCSVQTHIIIHTVTACMAMSLHTMSDRNQPHSDRLYAQCTYCMHSVISVVTVVTVVTALPCAGVETKAEGAGAGGEAECCSCNG